MQPLYVIINSSLHKSAGRGKSRHLSMIALKRGRTLRNQSVFLLGTGLLVWKARGLVRRTKGLDFVSEFLTDIGVFFLHLTKCRVFLMAEIKKRLI